MLGKLQTLHYQAVDRGHLAFPYLNAYGKSRPTGVT